MFANSLFSAVALSALASTAFATDCTRSYAVSEGDICDSISAANNVSTYQLAALNPAIDAACSNLTPGQTLCLGTPGEDCTTTYVVKPGDFCDAVSAAHGTNTTILYLNNPQINAECTNIYVGEVLCVAPTVLAPPAPAGPLPTSIPATAAPANPTPTPEPETLPTPEPAPAPPAPAPEEHHSGDDGDDYADDDDIPYDQLPYCDEL